MKILIFTFLSFIAIGLPEGALGIAWPSIRDELGLSVSYIGYISIFSLVSYSMASFVVPKIKLHDSIKAVVGLFLMSVAFMLFGLAYNFIFILIFAAFAGFSIAIIDIAVNSFMTKNFTSRYVNWLNCFFGVGATISPLIFGTVAWRAGYKIISLTIFLIGILVLYSKVKRFWNVTPMKEEASYKKVSENKVVKHINAALFFLMAGIEYSIGMLTITVLIESRSINLQYAGTFTATYFAFTIVGRIIFGILAKYINNMNLLRIGFLAAATGLITITFTSNIFSMVLLGLGMGPVFPCLMHETKSRVKKENLERQIGYQLASLGMGSAIIGFSLSNLIEYFMEFLFPIALIILVIMALLNEKANHYINGGKNE